MAFSALAQAAEPTAPPASDEPSARVEATPAVHKKKRKKKRPAKPAERQSELHAAASEKPKPTSGLDFKASASSGFQHGLGVRRFDSPVFALRAQWSPWRRLGPVRFELPFEYQQLNLPAADLNEVLGNAALRAALPLSRRLEPFAALALSGVWRPSWPDLYQPLPAGGLRSTDRFSYLQRTGQLGAQGLLGHATRARIAYSYSLWDYRTDPAFRPVDAPNHLPPSDHDEHALKLGASSSFGPFRARLTLDLFQRDYFFVFARDRRTGKTHAGPGGLPANPLYVTRGAEPELAISARLSSLSLRGSFGVQLIDDVFQGYYSSVAHHPALGVRWSVSKKWSLELAGELWLRRYGPDSYAQGPGHPALTFGDRRAERTTGLLLESRWKLSNELTLLSSANATLRRSNFPNYEPGIFPRSARYSIAWSYDNWQLLTGVEYRSKASE